MASSDNSNKPTARVINLAAEIKRMWGPEWNKPEVSYRFGDREFFLRTQDAGAYDGTNYSYVLDDYILTQTDYVEAKD